MIGERENIYPDTNYGTLVVQNFDIDGNQISAFYDSENNLVFVLDNTINARKPNVLLVINPDGDKKWDEILSSDYDVDLETIRPKVDNKYQKLDIEYSGLSVYENLINAYKAGDALEDQLNQLAILRDAASRHSAMTRLNVANETISKTNTTIVKTKETIVRLQARIKTLRSKLSAAKKEIGKVATKQSASKILKLESQIDATNEKLKRAKKRLESAQKRLEVATVDAELASNLLNQPSIEIKQKTKSKPVMVAPEYPVQTTSAPEEETEDDDFEEEVEEEVEESDVKPLFEKDPQILNEDIAFKPIAFDAPVFNDIEVKEEKETLPAPVVKDEPRPVLDSMTPIEEPRNELVAEEKPILQSFEPINDVPEFIPEPVKEEETIVESFKPINDVPEFIPEPVQEEKPVLETMTPVVEESETVVEEAPAPVAPAPVMPAVNSFQMPSEVKSERSKPGFIYYILLLILILLSVFTLWLYQKNMKTDTMPVLTAKAPETTILEPKKAEKKVAEPVVNNDENEPVFLDDAEPENTEAVKEEVVVPVTETVAEPEQIETAVAEEPEGEDEEVIHEPEAPVVMDVVPGRLNTSGMDNQEEMPVVSEEDILASKPVFEPGAKYDEMFIDEQDFESGNAESDYSDGDYGYDPYYDEEEAAYQAEYGDL